MTQAQVNKLSQRQREQLIKQLFKVNKTVEFKVGSLGLESKASSGAVGVSCGQVATYITLP